LHWNKHYNSRLVLFLAKHTIYLTYEQKLSNTLFDVYFRVKTLFSIQNEMLSPQTLFYIAIRTNLSRPWQYMFGCVHVKTTFTNLGARVKECTDAMYICSKQFICKQSLCSLQTLFNNAKALNNK